MRKLFTLLSLTIVATILFASCSKEDVPETLSLDISEVVFAANEELTQSIEITSNSIWEITKDESDWLTVTPLTGTNNQTITVTATENDLDTRIAVLTIKTATKSVTLNITQNSYELEIVDFEDIVLGDEKYSFGTYTNKDTDSGEKINSYSNSGLTFTSYVNEMYKSWNGISYSSNTDMKTEGYTNQYSVYNTSGYDGSSNFAVIFEMAFYGPSYTPNMAFGDGIAKTINHLYINNSTYTALSMLKGDSYAKKFVAGDWFKVTITGVDATGEEGKSIDFYLADYRDGESYVIDEWTKVDLSLLGEVNKVTFKLSSSDVGLYGMNTPSYLCIDNIAIRK